MNRVDFYCGPSIEHWDGNSLGKGIGGSETSLVHLASRLSENHLVTVYNDCEKEKLVGEVLYYPFNLLKFPPESNLECDTLIVWRSPELLTDPRFLGGKSKAKRKILWLHDLIPEVQLLPFIYLYDKIVVQTKYHRSIYPNVPEEKFEYILSGVDMGQIESVPGVDRDPWQLVYASSYDRGLVKVLTNWTRLKLKFPKLTLKIMYGWNTMRAIAEERKAFEWFKGYMEDLFSQEGVEELGRLPQEEVLAHMAASQLWVYPATWPETACLVGMQSQSVGAVPCVIPAAALRETVLGGFTGANETEWLALLENALEHPEEVEELREMLVPKARKAFDWDTLAFEWESILEA